MSPPVLISFEGIDRPRNAVMEIWIVGLLPFTKILVSIMLQAIDDTRPIESRTAIVASRRVRQIQLRRNEFVANGGFWVVSTRGCDQRE